MKSDEIYKILEHQAKITCGNLWNDMSNKEQTKEMLKIAIIMIKECYEVQDETNS